MMRSGSSPTARAADNGRAARDLADRARALDAADPLAPVRDRFALPPDLLYLDGNSLGPLPHAAREAMADVTARQWGERLIRGWNEGWIDAPARIGAKLAPLLGAGSHEVIVGDTNSWLLQRHARGKATRAEGRVGRAGRDSGWLDGWPGLVVFANTGLSGSLETHKYEQDNFRLWHSCHGRLGLESRSGKGL